MSDVPIYVSEEYERQKWRRRRNAIVSFIAVLCLAAIGAAWLVVRSPLFEIQGIEILGNERVSDDAVLSALMAGFPRQLMGRVLTFRNILAWPEGSRAEVLQFLPKVSEMEIEKDYGQRKISVRVSERKPFGIWCFKKDEPPRCFWFDEGGSVLEGAPEAEGNLIAVVSDYSRSGLSAESRVLPPEFTFNLVSIFKVLKVSETSVKEVRLDDLGLQEIKVLTHGGPAFYFSLRFPAENTLAVIESLKGKGGFGKLEYVDFRVENRAYYK